MTQARALLVGLKEVSRKSYGDLWSAGCELSENNVDQMASVLTGFSKALLKTKEATADNILLEMKRSSDLLREGDIFVFYFAGHGFGGGPSEARHMLGSYDQPLDTRKFGEIWNSFDLGVRIVMISDSCNSGTDYSKYLASLRERHGLDSELGAAMDWTPLSPFMTDRQANSMRAQMLHFGAASDGEPAIGGEFTKVLLSIWNNGSFSGGYRKFFCRILSRVNMNFPGLQRPEYRPYGPVTDTFEAQRPFDVAVPDSSNNIVNQGILRLGDCSAV